MYDPKNPTQGITPALPQANPDNSAVVQSMTTGKPYAETITQQANTPFGQSTGITQNKQTSFSDATNPQPASTSSPTTTGLTQASTATSTPSSSAPTSTLNAYGNDMSLANRFNAVADQMKADREATYTKPALPEPISTSPANSGGITNPFGNSEMGIKMLSNLANMSLGKGYGGLAGIGAMTGGMQDLPSGNFGDRAKRNKILNERGQQYLSGLLGGAGAKSPFEPDALKGSNYDAFKPDSLR